MLDAIRKAFARRQRGPPRRSSARTPRAPARTARASASSTRTSSHLDPVISVCERCEGRRFTDEVLQHTLRGASIADVYDMQADAALEFFTEKPVAQAAGGDARRRPRLPHARPAALHALGRRAPAPEARQRARREREGRSCSTSRRPACTCTTSTASSALLDRLVDGGATVIVIEHDPEVIARADWVIDLGPGRRPRRRPRRLRGHAAAARGAPELADRAGTSRCAMRDGYAELGTVRLHYVEAGEGPLVVLLHGFPEFWYGWRHQIEPLAEAGFRVVAPDMRGYNLSSKPRGVAAYDLELLAAGRPRPDRGARRAERAYVAGHDWGGAVAWATAMLPPARSSSGSRSSTRPHPRRFIERCSRPAPARESWYMLALPAPLAPELLGQRACAHARFPARTSDAALRGGLGPAGRADRDAQLLPRALARDAAGRGAAHPHRRRADAGHLGPARPLPRPRPRRAAPRATCRTSSA